MFDYITVILILILIYVLYYFNHLSFINKTENFRGGGGHSGGEGRTGLNGGGRGYGGDDIGRDQMVGSNTKAPLTDFKNAAYTLDTTAPDMKVTDNKVDNAKDYPKIVKDDMANYNKLLGDDDKEVTYYYNDVINQSNINENADDLVNQIDLVDYSNVKTGLQKCEAECKGVCFELGYMGTATCFPMQNRKFDYGSIYKNPTFIYG